MDCLRKGGAACSPGLGRNRSGGQGAPRVVTLGQQDSSQLTLILITLLYSEKKKKNCFQNTEVWVLKIIYIKTFYKSNLAL